MNPSNAVKSRRQPWILVGLLAWLGACSEPDAQISIPVAVSYDNQPLTCDMDAAPVRLTDLRFYVQDVFLLDATRSPVALDLEPDGQWQQHDIALLDLENGGGECQNGTVPMHARLQGTVKAGEYRGLVFTVGVPFDRNHGDPLKALPPLGDSAMHWSWRGGYKFFRAGIRTDTDGFWIHMGSAGCAGTINKITHCDYPNRVTVELPGFKPGEDRVDIDLAELLRGVDLDDGEASDCSSGPAEVTCDPAFRALGIDFATGRRVAEQRVFSSRAQD